MAAADEKTDPQVQEVRDMFESVSIAHFCATFSNQLKLRRFTMDELEDALVNPHGNLLLEELHYRLLPERPASFGDGVAWIRQLKITLYQYIDAFCDRYPQAIDEELLHPRKTAKKAKVFRRGKRSSRRLKPGEEAGEEEEEDDEEEEEEDDEGGDDEDDEGAAAGTGDGGADVKTEPAEVDGELDPDNLGILNKYRDQRSPLHTQSYFEIPVTTRVVILKALCDWKLETSEDEYSKAEREHLIGGKLDPDDLRVEPIGEDKKDTIYWFFEKIGCRVFKESLAKDAASPKIKRGSAVCSPPTEWTAAATNIEELAALIKKLGGAKSKKRNADAELAKELQPILEDWQENFDARERARKKQEQINLAMLNVKRSSRVQLLDQKKEEDVKKTKEQLRIAEIAKEAAELERKRQKELDQMARAQREDSEDAERFSPRGGYEEAAPIPVKEDAESRKKREKRERERARRVAEQHEQDAREEALEAERQEKARVELARREERMRRREMGEAAPPPPKELARQLQTIVKGDWVEVRWPEDNQWYICRVQTASAVRIKVAYPESPNWAAWDEIIQRNEVAPGRVRFPDPVGFDSS